jgi:erythromycin esterase
MPTGGATGRTASRADTLFAAPRTTAGADCHLVEIEGIMLHRRRFLIIPASLLACLLAACSEETPSGYTPPSNPWAGSDLMSDEELVTPIDPEAPAVRAAWRDAIGTYLEPLRSLDSDDFRDLAFLPELIRGKTVVTMGEVVHGVAEQNRIRVRLIKYLHQQHGFNVVAFESGFYDCHFTQQRMSQLSFGVALRSSIYSFWHTDDLLDLFHYVQESQSTANPLYLAGFDVQPTGHTIESRPAFLRDIVMPVDSTFAESFYVTDQHIVSYYRRPPTISSYIEANYASLSQQYGELVQLISTGQDELLEHFDEDTIRLALQVAETAKTFISFRSGDAVFNYQQRVYMRDRQMAENLDFIREQQYPDAKVIVWSHNAHVIKHAERVRNPGGGVAYTTMMGAWLEESYPGEVYTMISLGYRGSVSQYGDIQPVAITHHEGIEAILYRGRRKHFLVDLSRVSEQPGNSWMFEEVPQTYLHRSGNYDIQYVPRDQCDAVIFIDTLSPPNFVD